MLKRKIFSFIRGKAKNPEKNATHSEDLEKGKFHFNKGSIPKNSYKYLIVNTENKKIIVDIQTWYLLLLFVII